MMVRSAIIVFDSAQVVNKVFESANTRPLAAVFSVHEHLSGDGFFW